MMRNSFEKMPFRLRAFGTHLLASVCLLTLTLAVLYAGWYRWPGWYLVGAEAIVGLLILVDVGVGPLATLVVSNPHKRRGEWRRDIALIVVIQLAALGYGAYTLWLGRPLFYVFSLDRVEVVQAADFKEETVEVARHQDARIFPEWQSLPRWIWAPLPDDAEERQRIVASAIFDGEDVVTMPQYFRPWSEGRAALRERLLPMSHLSGLKAMSESDYQARLAGLALPEASVGVLPVKGSRRDGAWIFDRERGEPVAFWPVEIWSVSKQAQ